MDPNGQEIHGLRFTSEPSDPAGTKAKVTQSLVVLTPATGVVVVG